MTITTDLAQILLRHGTAAEWTSTNPVLGLPEIGVESDTKLMKMGDGVTAWVSLGYMPEQLAAQINLATAKTTPVDADQFGVVDSADSNRIKKTTWANIKTVLLAYFNSVAQTLTNKSISLTTNTVTGTIAEFNTAVTDANLATLAGAETLTNKDLSSSNTFPVLVDTQTHAASGKATPVDADEFAVMDSASSYGLKKSTFAQIKAVLKSYFDSVAQTFTNKDLSDSSNTFPVFIGTQTHAATGKTTPVDGDELPLSDSAASYVAKKVTYANLKATLKTYFDGLFAPIASPTFTGTVSGVTKSMVGLSNVDNTSDAAKPVSTAQQTALDLKANLISPIFVTPNLGVPSAIDLTNATNAPAAPAETLLSTTAITGISSVSITSISQAHKHLRIVIENAATASTNRQIRITLNANNGSVYSWVLAHAASTALTQQGGSGSDVQVTGDVGSAANSNNICCEIFIPRYASTVSTKMGRFFSSFKAASGAWLCCEGSFATSDTAAISSVQVKVIGGGNFTAQGNIYIYGCN